MEAKESTSKETNTNTKKTAAILSVMLVMMVLGYFAGKALYYLIH